MIGRLALVAMASTLSLTSFWQAITRETNSHAANRRGVKAYGRSKFDDAARDFARGNALRPSPSSSFNLGTAQVAAGKREAGAETLTRAMADPALRFDALYNRGNSALLASSYDYAIRDYTDALKLRPTDGRAKRNLEIALMRKQQQQEARAGQKPNPQGAQPDRKSTQRIPSGGPKQEEQRKGDANADALLRAVQQQEQEELQRMKRARGDRQRVGW